MSGPNGSSGGVDFGLAVVAGQVALQIQSKDGKVLYGPVPIEPQNAFDLGEAMARAAHEARFGEKIESDEAYIAAQIRARVTENLRAKAVHRVVRMLGSMERHRRTPAHIAAELVDAILREVT